MLCFFLFLLGRLSPFGNASDQWLINYSIHHQHRLVLFDENGKIIDQIDREILQITPIHLDRMVVLDSHSFQIYQK